MMRQLLMIAFAASLAPELVHAEDYKDALAAFEKKDFSRAVSILDKHLEEHPRSNRAHALRGRALVELGQYEKSLPDLDKVLSEKKGERGLDHFYRGRARIALGRHAEAIADFDASIEANPKVVERYMARGMAWLQFSEPTKALSDFEKAVEVDPKHSAAWLELGRLRCKQACEFEVRAYEKDGKTYTAQVFKGIRDREGFERGVSDLSRAIELNPDFVDAIGSRMQAYRILGNKGAERIADLRSLCRLLPDQAVLWNELAWDLSTHFRASLRNGKEAVEAAEKAVKLTRNQNPLFLDTLAAAYAEIGQFDKAIATLAPAIEKIQHAETKAAFEKRLELYKNGKPYHRTRSTKMPKAESSED